MTSELPTLIAKFESASISSEIRRTPGGTATDVMAAGSGKTKFDATLAPAIHKFLNYSSHIGGHVAEIANLFKTACNKHREIVISASDSKKPDDQTFVKLLEPLSKALEAIQEFKDKNRDSPHFSHLSAVADSAPALGWVTVTAAPVVLIGQMIEAGTFYGNRVIQEYKERDTTHVEWNRSLREVLTELQKYVKQYHTTGLVWSSQGDGVNDDVKTHTDIFSEINVGMSITEHVKPRDAQSISDKKTPILQKGARNDVIEDKAEAKKEKATDKPATVTLDGKKWIVEYHKGNPSVVIDKTAPREVVYIFKCENSTIKIKGKVNSITVDSCKKVGLVFDDVISSCDTVNSQRVQVQVTGKVPTITIDKTDGFLVYLSKNSLDAEIVTAKSSEMNVLVPDDSGEFKEFPVPEQFKTVWNGSKLVTTMVDRSA